MRTADTAGRLLALRCLGIPEVATRTPMSPARVLRRRAAAYCARLRPRNTAELASLVLHLGEEIDRRERMLDAAMAPVMLPGRVNELAIDKVPGSAPE